MKKYIVAAFLSIPITLISLNFNAYSETFNEPQTIDKMSIDELTEQNRKHLKDHDFESIIQKLPDGLLFDICNETGDYGRWVGIKVHSLLMLGQKDDARELMEKVIQQPLDEDTSALMFWVKYFTDCLNDNYGDATISITKVIERNEKSTGMSGAEVSAFIFYQMRADAYAARRMHKEAEDDLVKMQELRRRYPNVFLTNSPGEYMLRKYLEDTEDKSFHRVEMPPNDPSKINFTVNWWCCGLSEEDKDEYYRLFVEPLLQTGER